MARWPKKKNVTLVPLQTGPRPPKASQSAAGNEPMNQSANALCLFGDSMNRRAERDTHTQRERGREVTSRGTPTVKQGNQHCEVGSAHDDATYTRLGEPPIDLCTPPTSYFCFPRLCLNPTRHPPHLFTSYLTRGDRVLARSYRKDGPRWNTAPRRRRRQRPKVVITVCRRVSAAIAELRLWTIWVPGHQTGCS